jgi:hypothetical protein
MQLAGGGRCRRLEGAAAGLRRRWQVQPALLSVLHGCWALQVLLLSLPLRAPQGRRAADALLLPAAALCCCLCGHHCSQPRCPYCGVLLRGLGTCCWAPGAELAVRWPGRLAARPAAPHTPQRPSVCPSAIRPRTPQMQLGWARARCLTAVSLEAASRSHGQPGRPGRPS